MAGPERDIPTLAKVLTQASLDEARKIVLSLSRSGQLSLADVLAGVPHERAEEILAGLPPRTTTPATEPSAGPALPATPDGAQSAPNQMNGR